MVPNGGILCLAEDPERAHGRDYHSGSEEQPDKIHYARKLTASGSELAIERMASNRGREGHSNDRNSYVRLCAYLSY